MLLLRVHAHLLLVLISLSKESAQLRISSNVGLKVVKEVKVKWRKNVRICRHFWGEGKLNIDAHLRRLIFTIEVILYRG